MFNSMRIEGAFDPLLAEYVNEKILLQHIKTVFVVEKKFDEGNEHFTTMLCDILLDMYRISCCRSI